ncbi:MAG: MFS transporter [Candidatus Sumerlaeaceae bacterium]|nr:MFS transporter [Candidatus Sumerlaeaceae bacterium]
MEQNSHSQTSKFVGPLVIVASVVLQLAIGAIYAWSTIAAALQKQYGLQASQTSSVMGVAVLTFTVVMIPAGRGVARWGPRPLAVVGGILFSLGYLISSFAKGSYFLTLAGTGFLVGTGIGCAYTAPLTTCLAWYPQRKGLMTGLAVTGFGAGALLLSLGVEALLARGWKVDEILRAIAVGNGSLAVMAALCLRMPPEKLIGTAQPLAEKSDVLKLNSLVRMSSFWAACLGMFCATFGGLLVIGNLKPIGLSYGLEAAAAGSAVGIFAIGNAVGRLVWGGVYDRLRRTTLPLALLIQAVLLAVLAFAREPLTFALVSGACGFLFGSAFVLYAADLASDFGPKAVSLIYPWVFLAYGLAGLVGPYVGGKIFDVTGSYTFACFAAALISLGGAGGYTMLRRESFVAGAVSKTLQRLGFD